MKTGTNHKKVADKYETISMGLGITSSVVAAGAADWLHQPALVR